MQPAERLLSLSPLVVLAVTATIGVSSSSFILLILVAVSYPSSPGIFISIRIRAGLISCALLIPLRPSSASNTEYPLASSTLLTSVLLASLSSI